MSMPAAQLRLLRPLAHPAEDHRVPQLEVLAVAREALLDLRRELARRRQDQRAHLRLIAGHRVDPLEDRQREGSRLTGACARAADR
jgi:hypothetical protein